MEEGIKSVWVVYKKGDINMRLSLKYKSVIKKYFHQFFNDGEIYLFDKKIKFLSRIKVVFNTDGTRLKFFRNLGFNLGWFAWKPKGKVKTLLPNKNIIIKNVF